MFREFRQLAIVVVGLNFGLSGLALAFTALLGDPSPSLFIGTVVSGIILTTLVWDEWTDRRAAKRRNNLEAKRDE